MLVASGVGQQGQYGNQYGDALAVYRGVLLLGSSAAIFFSAIFLIAIGEVIKVFVDIEHNTSETAQSFRNMRPQKNHAAETVSETPVISAVDTISETPIISEDEASIRGIQTDLSKAQTWSIDRGETVTTVSANFTRRLKDIGYQVEYYPRSNLVFSINGKQKICSTNREIQRFANDILSTQTR